MNFFGVTLSLYFLTVHSPSFSFPTVELATITLGEGNKVQYNMYEESKMTVLLERFNTEATAQAEKEAAEKAAAASK